MAINFAGLLGGLGVGAQQLAAQREQERQFNINRQFAERQFAESQLGRQQQYELQKSAAERADALAERQSKELRNKELGLANQSVVSLLSADLQDEEKALEELERPGLSATDIEGIRARRRKRRKVVEDALASFDKMTGYSDLFGSALSRLQASPIAGADALRITPKVNWTQYAGFLTDARKAIAAAAPKDQEGEWQNQIAQLATLTGAPIEEVQTKLARPGSLLPGIKPQVSTKERAPTAEELGIYGPTPTPINTAQALREMAAGKMAALRKTEGISGLQPPGLQPSETLPGGAQVTRTFDPVTGMVTATETAAPARVKYTTPEIELLRSDAVRLQNEERRLLMGPKFKAAIEDLNTKRLRNILTQKEINWYDRIQASNIASKAARVAVQKAQAAAKAGAEKGISLADTIRMFSAESLNAYRDNQTWLAGEKMRQGRISQLSGEITKLETLANAAEVKAAESADKAMKNVQTASLKVAESLRTQAKALREQLQHIQNGNAAGMASFTGSSLGGFNPATASSAGLASFLQGGQARIQNLMQTGVQGMQSGMQGQQQPQGQGGTVVNLGGISIGGGQVGAAGGGVAGGPTFPQPGWYPGDGRFDPNNVPGADPTRISQWQLKYPNVDGQKVAGYVRPDGTIDPTIQKMLADMNTRATKPKPGQDKPGGGRPEPSPVKPVQVPVKPGSERESGYYIKGTNTKYTGNVTRFGPKVYAGSMVEVDRMMSAKDVGRKVNLQELEFVPEKRSAWTVPGSNKPYTGPTVQWKGKTYPMSDAEFSARFRNKPVTETDLPRPLERGRF